MNAPYWIFLGGSIYTHTLPLQSFSTFFPQRLELSVGYIYRMSYIDPLPFLDTFAHTIKPLLCRTCGGKPGDPPPLPLPDLSEYLFRNFFGWLGGFIANGGLDILMGFSR